MNDFQVLHGAERGERAAILLSPLRPANLPDANFAQNGSQFTFFLTAPLSAFCQLVGLSPPDIETVKLIGIIITLAEGSLYYNWSHLFTSDCRMLTMMLKTCSQLPSLNWK